MSPAIHDCWNQIGVVGNGTCRELVKFIHCRNCPVYTAAGLQMLDRALPAAYRRERGAHYAQPKQLAQPARVSVVVFRLGGEWLALPTNVFQEVAEHLLSPAPTSRPAPTLEGKRGAGGAGRSGPAGHRLHSLPHRRGGLTLGLVNVRGELVICVTVARLLGVEADAEMAKAGSLRPNFRRGGDSAERTTCGPEGRNIPIAPDSVFSFSRLLVTNWKGQRVAFPVDEVAGIQRFSQAELKAPPATTAKSVSTCMRGVFEWRDRTVGLLDAEVFFRTLNRNLA